MQNVYSYLCGCIPHVLFELFEIVCFPIRRCCCGRLVRQHAGFTASLATKYSDVKLGENPNPPMPELEEWSVEKHTEASPTDAYGVINFQGGSHSYRAKVTIFFSLMYSIFSLL